MTSTDLHLAGADAALPGSAARVRQVLADLPAHEYRAISMALYQGMSCRLVASALGVPEGAVRNWMRSGLGRIRTELTPTVAVGPA